ncbi:MAG: Ppx/GppA family phosphatase [Actinobacteria bacterium]|nr:Ppx/GppA family phosphatase [Actinomycetota bacterium]NCU78147.1 Ppx/GppA family phosphatase [Actinomycetota bacterium]NCU96326.1 Ppx/GppA family phosphatase [Actinomycetota bacterium]NCZ76528.1 Ppx/GppA family phosphatase [Actinomycetota bacterium]
MTRVAAIDCGTNSIRLLIADIDNGEFKEIVRSMEVVRLGQGVDKNKLFQPDAIDRTLAAVDNFNEEIVSKSVEKIRFCATSATRDATNRSLFTDGVKNILGVEVEVILGDEEAKLSYFGATKGLKQSDAPFLVVDIGGGSTEFVYGHEKVEFAKSVDIGCVRMSERHLNTQPVTMDQVARAIVDIDKAIAQAAAIVPISAAKTLIAVAGTATTVAAAALELKEYDRNLIHLSRISADKVYEVSAMLQSMQKNEIAELGYMHPGRVDVITAGSLVLSRVMAATGASEFVASESDILDGMAWSLVD